MGVQERVEVLADNGEPGQKVKGRGRSRAKDRGPGRLLWLQNGALSSLVALVVIAAVEWGVEAGAISELILPKPSSVFNAVVAGFGDGSLIDPLLSTISATLVGFLVATVTAVLLGGAVAISARLEAVMMPFVIAFQSTPIIAIAPVILLWIGYGFTGKVFIVASISFFPILINVIAGLRIRDQGHLDLFSAMGATTWQMFWHLRAPGSLPYVFAGLNIGLLVSLLGAVVAEFVGSQGGLGVYLLGQRALFNLPAVFASIILLAAVGIILRNLIVYVEKKAVFWSHDLTGRG